MAYDRLAESLALIEAGTQPTARRLSRRHRFAPLAVDVEGVVAATMFLRRGSGDDWLEIWVLERRAGEWHVLGGGGGTGGDDVLAGRPTQPAHGPQLHLNGSGWVRRTRGGRLWSAPGVTYAHVRAAHGVAALRVFDRELAVPDHGNLVVVWTRRRAPRAEALAADGTVLGSQRLTGSPRHPSGRGWWRARHRILPSRTPLG